MALEQKDEQHDQHDERDCTDSDIHVTPPCRRRTAHFRAVRGRYEDPTPACPRLRHRNPHATPHHREFGGTDQSRGIARAGLIPRPASSLSSDPPRVRDKRRRSTQQSRRQPLAQSSAAHPERTVSGLRPSRRNRNLRRPGPHGKPRILRLWPPRRSKELRPGIDPSRRCCHRAPSSSAPDTLRCRTPAHLIEPIVA